VTARRHAPFLERAKLNPNDKSYKERVFDLVRLIPPGKVMTYGQIAIVLGEGYTPRTVGYVMNGADRDNVPWQRVINSQGGCSTGKMTIPVNLQEELLKAEGIDFNDRGKCDLREYQWWPEGHEPDENEIEQTTLFG
jgi:methylated-DNA-protein-cysteine methyltransferase related protein